MGQDPREAWRKLQTQFKGRTGGGFPGGPRFSFGLGGGIVILVGGAWAINNALFNGEWCHRRHAIRRGS